MLFIQVRFYGSHKFPCRSLLLSTTILNDTHDNDNCVLVVCYYLPTASPQATWNMSMLQSGDLTTAVQAMIEKKKPNFSKL